MFGERGFVRWHLEDDGAGEVQLVPYDPDGSTQSFLFDSLDELDPRVALSCPQKRYHLEC